MLTLKKTAATLTLLGLAASGAHAQIVISQVYGGGGSTATSPVPSYKYDFIELYNDGTTLVNLATAGYTLQYASAGGAFSTTNTNTLQGTIAPGDYYLVREGSPAGTITGADLTSFNDAGSLNLSATAGKVALANSSTTVTFTSPNTFTSGNVVDFVGYGTTATTYEGAGFAPAPSTTTSIARTLTGGKYIDTNNNNTDFTVDTPPAPHTGAYVYVAPTPEPSSVVSMLLGAGALGLIAVRRRRTMNAA